MPITNSYSQGTALESGTALTSDPSNTALVEACFKNLAAQWKLETRFVSNVTTKAMHEAYQRIIGLGPIVVPLILQDLMENGPNDWFWALHVITNANPITPEMAGKMKAMTEAWLTWGRKMGYLPNYQPTMNNVSPTSP